MYCIPAFSMWQMHAHNYKPIDQQFVHDNQDTYSVAKLKYFPGPEALTNKKGMLVLMAHEYKKKDFGNNWISHHVYSHRLLLSKTK